MWRPASITPAPSGAVSAGPTAAMRSPSMRTSARVSAAGAPLRIRPPRMRSDMGASDRVRLPSMSIRDCGGLAGGGRGGSAAQGGPAMRSAALPSFQPSTACANPFGPSDGDPADVVRGRHPYRSREPAQRGPTLDLVRPIGRRHDLHARQGDAVTGSTAHHRRPGGHVGHQGALRAHNVDLSFGSAAVPRAYLAPHTHRDDPLCWPYSPASAVGKSSRPTPTSRIVRPTVLPARLRLPGGWPVDLLGSRERYMDLRPPSRRGGKGRLGALALP